MHIKKPNRPGSLKNNYKVHKWAKYPKKLKSRGIVAETDCIYCVPINKKKFLLSIRKDL